MSYCILLLSIGTAILHYICTLILTITLLHIHSAQIVSCTKNQEHLDLLYSYSKFSIKHFVELTSPRVDQSAT